MTMPKWSDFQNAYDSARQQYNSQYGEDPSGVFGFNVPGLGYVTTAGAPSSQDGSQQFVFSPTQGQTGYTGEAGAGGRGYYLTNSNGDVGLGQSYLRETPGQTFAGGLSGIMSVLAAPLAAQFLGPLLGGAGATGDVIGSDWASGLSSAMNPGLAAGAEAAGGLGAGADVVGSDWASGLESAMNPGNVGQYIPVDPLTGLQEAPFDNPGSDWSHGDPSAMNPGNQGTFTPIDPATGQPYADNPGSDWSHGDPGSMNPGNQGTYVPIDPATGKPYPDNPGSDWSHGDPAAQNPGNQGPYTPVDPAINPTNGTQPPTTGTPPGAGIPAPITSILPKLIGALLGAGPGSGSGAPGTGLGAGLGGFGGSSTPANETPGMLAAQAAPSNNNQAVAQALLLGNAAQPQFNFGGYQQMPDIAKFAQYLQGDSNNG